MSSDMEQKAQEQIEGGIFHMEEELKKMVAIDSYDKKRKIGLLPCPFCGSDPELKHIGNYHTKKRSIMIKCPKCRIQVTNGAIYHAFEWIENISAENWNKRTK